MIKLCNDTWQVTILDWMLMSNGISYATDANAVDIGIGFPYLLVDGVPLDEERAIKWIKGSVENE